MRRLFFALCLLAMFAASFCTSAALAQWGSRGCSPRGPVGLHRLLPWTPAPGHGQPPVKMHEADQIWLQVELDDPAAELFLGGERMKQAGQVRNFISPHLPKGRYTYMVEVHWGTAMKTEVIPCQPGDALRVVMRRPGATTSE